MENFFAHLFQEYKYTMMGISLGIAFIGISPLIFKLIRKVNKKYWVTILVTPPFIVYLWWVYKVDQEAEAIKYTHQTEYMVTGIFLVVTMLGIAALYLLYHRIKQEILINTLNSQINDLKKDVKQLKKKTKNQSSDTDR